MSSCRGLGAMPQSDDNGVVTAAAAGWRPTHPQPSHNLQLKLSSHFPLYTKVFLHRIDHFSIVMRMRNQFHPFLLHQRSHNLPTACSLFSIFPHLLYFFFSFSPSILSNILQAQNCSQEGDYGRQKSSHYRGRLYRGATLCLSRKLLTIASTKRIIQYPHSTVPVRSLMHRKVPWSSRLWTKPPAWGFPPIAANILSSHSC